MNMNSHELKKINNYHQKYINEQKINKILKEEIVRQCQHYETQIEVLKSNHKTKIFKFENEHNFKINSIELEYNKLKDLMVKYNNSLNIII